MIFTPEHILKARHHLLKDMKEDEAPTPELCHKLLALDREDCVAIQWLGRLRMEAGDLVEAEALFWQSLELQPCSSFPYMDLARLMKDQPERVALGAALAELGYAKLELEDGQGRSDLFTAAKAQRGSEPLQVTERLHHLRLLDDMLGQEDLSTTNVDTILSAGPAMIPLLVAILRAWASDLIEEEDCILENALALLGELGTAQEIPHLLEFVALDHPMASGAARWALHRIVERHTPEARQLFRTLAPDMGLMDRMTVVDQVIHHGALDPDGTTLESLTENLGTLQSSERDRFFTLLVSGMIAKHGAKGLPMAREALRRHRTQLTLGARRECEDMLEYFGLSKVAPMEASPSEWTVYDICQGKADWATDEENGDEPADEFDLPPAPIRRPVAPGRNDPCWCNSGKKYKKCHLDSDQRGEPGTSAAPAVGGANEFSGLRERIGNFLGEALTKREKQRAVEEFTQAVGPDDELDTVVIVDWMLHDWISPRLGTSVMAEFLRCHESSLSPREREMVAAWAKSFISLYEVEDVQPGVGLKLRDVLLGGSVFAHDRAISGKVVRWDGLFARAVPGERGIELGGAGQFVQRGNIAALMQWMEEERSARDIDWRSYLKGNWPLIRRQAYAVAQAWSDALRITNTDGEELVIALAVYKAGDQNSLSRALAESGKLEAEDHDAIGLRFVWLNEDRTVLARISLADGELRLETNSRERLAQGKELLGGIGLTKLAHVRDEFQSAEELKQKAQRDMQEGVVPIRKELPDESQRELISEYLEDYYAKWPDTKLPGLGGKAPREAARSASGRLELIDILHTIENGEERKRLAGHVPYDVAKLYAALGLNRV